MAQVGEGGGVLLIGRGGRGCGYAAGWGIKGAAAAHQVVEGGGGGWGGWTGTGEPRTTGAGSHAHHKVVTPICLCPSALPSGHVPGLDGLHDTSYCLLRYVTVCFCTQVAFQVWMACGLLADSLAVAAQVRY